MNRARGHVSYYQLSLLIIVGSLLLVTFALPTHASALEISAQTAQILPLGGNGCAPIAARDFTPYIYDGALHSFEFTVPDSSYVALVGSVGNTSIPFQRFTRGIRADGTLRIHMDVETTSVSGSLPLSVTLLSARSGQPVCLSIISTNVGTAPTAYVPSVSSDTVPAPESVTAAPTNPEEAETTPTVTAGGESPSGVTAAPVVGTLKNPLRNICSSDAVAFRTWLILLVLFTLLVGGSLWAEFPMSLPWARTPERVATIILALLLALLAFWYLSVSCRAALWMPILAFLITVLGLLAAFWNHPRVTQLLLVQDAKTIKLPQAKK